MEKINGKRWCENIGLQDISLYRSELMGIAAISVVLFHYIQDLDDSGVTGIISVIVSLIGVLLGSNGVEIFVFLSGMGLYFSWKKTNSVIDFLKRRFIRIIPTYVVCSGMFWIILDFILKKAGPALFFKDLFLFSFWLDGTQSVWYVAFSIAVYLLFPFFVSLIDRGGHIKRKIIYGDIACSYYRAYRVRI